MESRLRFELCFSFFSFYPTCSKETFFCLLISKSNDISTEVRSSYTACHNNTISQKLHEIISGHFFRSILLGAVSGTFKARLRYRHCSQFSLRTGSLFERSLGSAIKSLVSYTACHNNTISQKLHEIISGHFFFLPRLCYQKFGYVRVIFPT